MYGFNRMAKKGGDYGAYYHELFLRGRPDLCSRITRVKSNPEVRFSRREPDFYSMDPVGGGSSPKKQLSSQSKCFDNGMLVQIRDEQSEAGLRTAAEISGPSSRQITRDQLSRAAITAVDRERLQNETTDDRFSVSQPYVGKHVGLSSAALCFTSFPNDRGNGFVRGLHQLANASYACTLSGPASSTNSSQESSYIASPRVCIVEASGPPGQSLLTRHWVDHSTTSFSQNVDQYFNNLSSPARRPPWTDQECSLLTATILQLAPNMSVSASESCPTLPKGTTETQAIHNSGILLPPKPDAFLQLCINDQSAMPQAARAGDHRRSLTDDIHPPPTLQMLTQQTAVAEQIPEQKPFLEEEESWFAVLQQEQAKNAKRKRETSYSQKDVKRSGHRERATNEKVEEDEVGQASEMSMAYFLQDVDLETSSEKSESDD